MDENLNLEKNSEIEKALKEFEVKSVEQQAPAIQATPFLDGRPKMVWLVMKWFSFKEQKQAEYLILGFVVLAIIISLFLVFRGGGSSDANLIQQKMYPPGSPVL